jgi:hypothetical protein
MKIHRLDTETVALEEIDSLLADLLHKIPLSTDPSGSEAATARLFPAPTEGREPSADADWQEYVEPELRELFRDAVGVVRADLKRFQSRATNGPVKLEVPVKHLEAWIHALNQARLALTARYSFSEREIESETPTEGGARMLVLFQIHFYGLLQEFFLQQLD